MYKKGTCKSVFELFDVIKDMAKKTGWEVLNENEILFNDIVRDGEFCSVSGDLGAISSNAKLASQKQFDIILPRPFSPKSVSFKSLDDNKGVDIVAVLFDQTREQISLQNDKSGAKIKAPFNDKKYIRFIITPKGGKISDFHLNGQSEFKWVNRALYLYNGDKENSVYLNIEAFIATSNQATLRLGTASSYSPDKRLPEQLNAQLGYIYCDDKTMNYHISINKFRIIIHLSIHNSDDKEQKNKVTQVAYIGDVDIYGGGFVLKTPALVYGGIKDNVRWSNFNKNEWKFRFFTFGKSNDISTTMLPKDNNVREIIVAPENGEFFATNIVCYDNNNVYGELDGLINVILPDGINDDDEIQIDDKTYIVIADSCLAMLKE